MRLVSLLLFALLCLGETSGAKTNSSSIVPPKIDREFRGAWIAVVSNRDWPSRPGLSTPEQKAELRALIQKAADLRLNALFFQVRPACDAVYHSTIEPWSEFLTGEMGKAPSPGWDPLEYAIREAHARGIELHAWFNPYRAGFLGAKPWSSKHIRKTNPKLVRVYGNNYWLDPGDAAVQNHTTRVIMDVVRRYDIDGVHLDDYFYPYPESGEFPDQPTWNRYQKSGGTLDRASWRRDNVNKLVRRLQSEIAQEKGWVTFGVSPFGIWRPGYPAQIRGLDAYNGIFADARLWLAKGWVDYLAPQLYWPSSAPEQSYPVLLKWWQEQSSMGRPVWPGGAITSAEKWGNDEIVDQIKLTRNSAQPGYVHWNLTALLQNSKLQKDLLNRVYTEDALVPINPGDAGTVITPILHAEKKTGGQHLVRWSVPATQTVFCWVLQVKRGSKWETRILPAANRSEIVSTENVSAIAISAVSRFRNISPAVVYKP